MLMRMLALFIQRMVMAVLMLDDMFMRAAIVRMDDHMCMQVPMLDEQGIKNYNRRAASHDRQRQQICV